MKYKEMQHTHTGTHTHARIHLRAWPNDHDIRKMDSM